LFQLLISLIDFLLSSADATLIDLKIVISLTEGPPRHRPPIHPNPINVLEPDERRRGRGRRRTSLLLFPPPLQMMLPPLLSSRGR